MARCTFEYNFSRFIGIFNVDGCSSVFLYVPSIARPPQAFCLSELPLEEYAFSLGLASVPKVPGLERALEIASSAGGKRGDDGGNGEDGAGAENEKQREEARAKKNVNRSLQRLKEQIKADKLRKRLEVRFL